MNRPRQRKPRFRRIPNPEPLQITERDLLILDLISKHRFLRSDHLFTLVSGSRQHLVRRLGRLYHAKLLDRPRQQLLVAQLRTGSFLYTLTEQGRKALRSRGFKTFVSVPRLKGASSTLSLTHSIEVTEVLVALQTAAHKVSLQFLWHHDLLFPTQPEEKDQSLHPMRWSLSLRGQGRRNRTFVIPDGAFAIQDANGHQSWFFLELDRGTMPVARSSPSQTSFIRKIHVYKETRTVGVLWKRHEISGFRVLVVTGSQKRMASLQAATASCFKSGESNMFLFARAGDLLASHNPLSGWQTCSGQSAETALAEYT